MHNPEQFNLPQAEADSFASLYHIYRPNVDPAVILRYLPEDIVTQIAAQYEEYNATVAELGAKALQSQAQFHKQVAQIIGKSKR